MWCFVCQTIVRQYTDIPYYRYIIWLACYGRLQGRSAPRFELRFGQARIDSPSSVENCCGSPCYLFSSPDIAEGADYR